MAMAAQSSTCARLDDTFGPHAANCRGDFDFTLQFEETILSILPLAILLIIAPLRIWYLFKRDRKVVQSPVLSLKLVRIPSQKLPIRVIVDASTSDLKKVTYMS